MATNGKYIMKNGKRVKNQRNSANHPNEKATTSAKAKSNSKIKTGIKKTTSSGSGSSKSKSSSGAPTYKLPKAYESALETQINDALGKVTNREDFNYDPLQDASYKSLAKIYNQQGAQAARDTLGDMAALNGGLGSSAATSAAAQQRSTYNQQLAAQIPTLREQAYNEYLNNYNMNVTALDALMGRDDSLYGRYRDTVGDQQYQFETKYNTWRDKIADQQWNKSFNQSKKEWSSEFGWNKKMDTRNYKLSLAELALKKNSLNSSSSSKKKKKSSSGSRSSSSGYYSSSGSSGSSGSSSGAMSESLWKKTTPTRSHSK